MRVALFVPRFPVLSQTFILDQVTGLIGRGHEVAVFSESRPEAEPVHEDVRTYGLLDRVFYLKGSGGHRLRDLTGLAGLAVRHPATLTCLRRERAAPFGGRQTVLRKLNILRSSRFQPDIVHCHFGDAGLRFRFVSSFWRVPFVVSFYGADCSRDRVTRDKFYDPLFRQADRVTVLGKEMAQRLESLGCPSGRLRQVHLGIDPEGFSFSERGAQRDGRPARLLTVARLVEKKGVEYALRAIHRLSNAGMALHYDILGDGPLRPALEDLSQSLGIASMVTFHGGVDRTSVRRAMADTDIFVLPSVTASDGDQEGTPTVLMEAASCGLPVVSTYHAGIPEVVLDGVSGMLVPERDDSALADALASVLASPDRWAAMGRAGREHIERSYSIRLMIAELEALYTDVMANGS